MNVLFVSSGTRNKGPNTIVLAQGESLKRLQLSLDYFTIDQKGVKGYTQAIFKLRKVLNTNPYDIIHAHYGLAAIISFLARRSEKVMVSFMGDDLLGTNTKDKRVTRTSLLLARLNAFLAQKFYDFSIVKSREMQEKSGIKRATVIPNGVDIDLFYPESKSAAKKQLGIPNENKLVIFVANPDRAEKNFPLAKQALEKTGVPDIQFIPLNDIAHKDLVHYYNAAEVMILTSFHEGSPNVIKEAMACNCPIVSTDVGDVKWIMGKTAGCFIAGFDPEDFAAQLRMALDFAKENDRTQGRKRIIELELDSPSVASRIFDIYTHILER